MIKEINKQLYKIKKPFFHNNWRWTWTGNTNLSGNMIMLKVS
jgi:hypothetical protein